MSSDAMGGSSFLTEFRRAEDGQKNQASGHARGLDGEQDEAFELLLRVQIQSGYERKGINGTGPGQHGTVFLGVVLVRCNSDRARVGLGRHGEDLLKKHGVH